MAFQKNSRKFLAGTVTTALVASAIAPVAGAEESQTSFTDLNSSSDHTPNIIKAVDLGLVNGYGDEFRPGNNVTRGQVALILYRWLSESEDVDTSSTEAFDDVSADFYDSELYEASLFLREKGIFTGSNGNLNPSDPISRQAMAKVLVEAFELESVEGEEITITDLNSAQEWARDYITTLSENGVTVVENFRPMEFVTRAQFSTFVIRSIELDDSVSEEVNSGVSGFITNGDVAVEGSVVAIDGKTATTDENGYYRLLDIAAGSYDLEIQAAGYKTVNEVAVDVIADTVTSFSQNLAENLIDTNAITVSGTIVDQTTGSSINDATVTLEAYDVENEEWNVVASVETDNGEYSIDQDTASNNLELATEYRQTVSMAGYKDFVQTIELDSEDVTNVVAGIELDDIEAIDVSGTITDEDGEIVTGATVKISDENGAELGDVMTDAEGKYSVESLQLISGTYNVVVDDSTSAVSYTEFDVVEGTNAMHNIQLEAGYSVNASIGTESVNDTFGTDDADEANYSVELINGNTVIGEPSVYTGAADAEDDSLVFDFNRVAAGTYTLRLTGDYIGTEEYTVTVDGDEIIEGRATSAGVVTGQISTPSTEDIATVNLLNASDEVIATVESDEDGNYTFGGIIAGSYKVEVESDIYMNNSSDVVDVLGNNTTNVDVVDLKEIETTGNVSGVVRQSVTLAALENATVTYYADGEVVDSAIVTNAGTYTLEDLEAGTYDVVVRHAGSEVVATTQVIEAGDNLSRVNYLLEDGGDASLEISVVNAENEAVDFSVAGIVLTDAYAVEGSDLGVWTSDNAEATDTFTFEELAAGSYEVELDITSDDYVDVEQTVSIAKSANEELIITVDEVAAFHAVNFRVVNELNQNVQGATVVVFNEDGSINTVLPTNAQGSLDNLDLVDGNYTLAVYQNGYAVAERALDVDGANVTLPVIQLDKF